MARNVSWDKDCVWGRGLLTDVAKKHDVFLIRFCVLELDTKWGAMKTCGGLEIDLSVGLVRLKLLLTLTENLLEVLCNLLKCCLLILLNISF